MTISLFELFKIGVGPSSSHTVGPMVAARRFAEWLDARDLLGRTAHVEADPYGSLAMTGQGHAAASALAAARSEERRGGQGGGSPCRTRCAPDHYKKQKYSIT